MEDGVVGCAGLAGINLDEEVCRRGRQSAPLGLRRRCRLRHSAGWGYDFRRSNWLNTAKPRTAATKEAHRRALNQPDGLRRSEAGRGHEKVSPGLVFPACSRKQGSVENERSRYITIGRTLPQVGSVTPAVYAPMERITPLAIQSGV